MGWAGLPLHTRAPPASWPACVSKQQQTAHEICCNAAMLHLQDVELVVVVGDVGLVQLDVVAVAHRHARVTGLGARLVHLSGGSGGGGRGGLDSDGSLPFPLPLALALERSSSSGVERRQKNEEKQRKAKAQGRKRRQSSKRVAIENQVFLLVPPTHTAGVSQAYFFSDCTTSTHREITPS